MSMKYALLPVFALFAMYAQAQSFINIQYKNGTVTSINVDDVQEITFTKAEKGTADNPYTVAELPKTSQLPVQCYILTCLRLH